MRNKYCVLDLETTSIHSFKRFCNPFDKRNKMVVVATLLQDCDPELLYSKEGIKDPLLPLDLCNFIVGHNLKFDLCYVWDYPPLQEWLKKGGKVWDTMTAQYLLSAQFHKYPSLDELTEHYGGEMKDDRVTEMFKAGFGADEIDDEILLPYAEGDVINTEIILRGQGREAKLLGMKPIILAHMEHYLALTEMECNGLYFDLDKAQELRKEYEEKLEDVREKLLRYAFWNIRLDYNPDSDEHNSAVLFNTNVTVVEDIELKDENGEYLRYGPKAQRAGQIKTRKEKVQYKNQGFGLDPDHYSRPTKKEGVYSTDQKILQNIHDTWANARDNEGRGMYITGFCKLLLEYREATKFLSTYLYSTKQINKTKEEETGLIPLVQPIDGCIHHSLDTVQTRTGRLNSKNPNSQNIPRDLLQLFTSRYNDDGVIVAIDYCLAPETRVLTEDFIWKPIKDIKEGETLVGFDEFPKKGRRLWKQATVQRTKKLVKDCVRITTEEGEVICSVDHMWLVKNRDGTSGKLTWTRADELTTAGHITKVCEVWDTPDNFETGYASGFLDGEGYIQNGTHVAFGQSTKYEDNIKCLEYMNNLLEKYLINSENRFYLNKKNLVMRNHPSGLRTAWQAVGIFQCERLKNKLKEQYPGTNTGSKRARKLKILKIEHIGEREVIGIQTDTKTFLAEGFMSHNCQLEVRVQAFLAQSTQMIQDIKDGMDFHALRLSYAVDKPYETVVQLIEESEEWKLKRKKAKTISFEKAYGASPQKIANTTKLPIDTVNTIFRKEDERYPEVEEFYKGVSAEIKRTRVPTDKLLFIRDKRTGDTVTRPGYYQGIGYYTSITGKRYHFYEKAVLTKYNDVFTYFSPPDIYNYPVQGLAADIVSMQVGKLFRFMLNHRDKGLMINEVHDEVVLDMKKEYLDELLPQIKAILEDVDGSFKEYFGCRFNVPIEVDVSYGKSWGDCK